MPNHTSRSKASKFKKLSVQGILTRSNKKGNEVIQEQMADTGIRVFYIRDTLWNNSKNRTLNKKINLKQALIIFSRLRASSSQTRGTKFSTLPRRRCPPRKRIWRGSDGPWCPSCPGSRGAALSLAARIRSPRQILLKPNNTQTISLVMTNE